MSADDEAWIEWEAGELGRQARELREREDGPCEICGYEIEDEVYRGIGGKMCVHRLCWDIVWAGRWKKMRIRELLEREKVIGGKVG